MVSKIIHGNHFVKNSFQKNPIDNKNYVIYVLFETNLRAYQMKNLIFFFFIITFSVCINSQSKTEEDIESAYQNAKKGIYWALNNIPDKKVKLENDLISEDKLYASVKLEKEVEGIKIESRGFFHSNEVTIKIYKSDDSLIKDGYLRK